MLKAATFQKCHCATVHLWVQNKSWNRQVRKWPLSRLWSHFKRKQIFKITQNAASKLKTNQSIKSPAKTVPLKNSFFFVINFHAHYRRTNIISLILCAPLFASRLHFHSVQCKTFSNRPIPLIESIKNYRIPINI